MDPYHDQQVFGTLLNAHRRYCGGITGNVSKEMYTVKESSLGGQMNRQIVTNLPRFLQPSSTVSILNHHLLGATMFKITTKPPSSALFPSQDEVPSSHRKHPAELERMDIDDHDFGGPSSLAGVVTPGEVITSAKEFMRFVLPSLLVLMLISGDMGRMLRTNLWYRA